MQSWTEIDRRRQPFIRMGEAMFGGMYRRIRRSLLNEISNATQMEQIEAIASNVNFEAEMVESYTQFYLKATIAFASHFVSGYKHIRVPLVRKSEDEWMQEIYKYIADEGGVLISQAAYNHREEIIAATKKFVRQGIDEGWGIVKTAKEIGKHMKKADQWKAKRIARTETVRASNHGVQMGMRDLPGNKEKVWISTFDDRSRQDHMAMEGKTAKENEAFVLPDGSRLMFPGDPAGGAGQTINCRCGMGIILTSEIYR